MPIPIHLEEKELNREIEQLDINPESREIAQEEQDNFLKDLDIQISIQRDTIRHLQEKLNTILKICYYWDGDLHGIVLKINTRVHSKTEVFGVPKSEGLSGKPRTTTNDKERDYREYLEVV